MSGKPDHIEEAIYRTRSFLDLNPPDHPLRPTWSAVHSMLQNLRGLDQVGAIGSLRDIHSSNFESASHPSLQDLTTSLAQSNLDPLSEIECLNALIRIPHITDMSEIEDAIKFCRQLLASPLGGQVVDIASLGLGHILIRAFERTNKIEYLNEAISVIRDIPSRDPVAHTLRVQGLISFLITRFELLHNGEDLNELMQLFFIAVNDISVPIPGRFAHSSLWARLARTSRHPSTPTAYNYAMSSMQAYLTFSPTLHSQHLRLVAVRNIYEKLPLDYASYLIDRDQLEKAVEVLERGRALMWSEMRGFRPSIDTIRTADSDSADKFVAVNKELEMLTVSSSNDLDGGDSGIKGMGPYGDSVVRQQRLLDDRERLISHIQTKPGFENFLTPPPFDTLRSAALHGPVIMISHCEWRSDIMILLHDSPPSLIPTSDDFYDRANKLRDQLLNTRKKGLESKDYENALNSVLENLYELVGRPVIKRLNELNIPEQSRVWWCPTSAFCSLPLHAMGPIPSSDGSKRYFMDLYIPSYIPSLSALIESRKSDSQTIDKPSILLVVQPDKYMPGARKEMKVVQVVNTQVTTLFSKRATPTAVLKHLQDHRFAHIVCHGALEVGKPFDASFKLYAGEPLSLLDIVRSQLPDAEFAFLSACHTAELTDESIADEGLHLTAAMQYCGFRSVVGTMWAMADIDGRDLARDFYGLVFADDRQGVRHYERTAEALRGAVQRLRRKGGMSCERWVNFVHYGA